MSFSNVQSFIYHPNDNSTICSGSEYFDRYCRREVIHCVLFVLVLFVYIFYNKIDSVNYSLRPQKRVHYVDDTTPSDSSPDVEYAPREKYNCYGNNEEVNLSKREETSDESLSIGTPGSKDITAASHQRDQPPQQIQSHNISSSSEEDTGNDDFEMELLRIKEEADEKIIELKANGAVESAKIDENLKRELKRIEEETKLKILEIEEKRQVNIIRNKEKYEAARAKILSRRVITLTN